MSDAMTMNKSLLWLDDDILFHKTFPRMWKTVQTDRYCTGFWNDPGGILLLGASEWTNKQVWTHILSNRGICYDAFAHTLGSFAFLASKRVLPWIHRWLGLTNVPFDYIYTFVQQKGFPVRVVYPNIVIPDTFHASSISNARETGISRAKRMRWNLSEYL